MASVVRLATDLDRRCELLGRFPDMGRLRDEIASGLRSVSVQRYVIFYRVKDDAVQILRILNGARDIESIMQEDEE